MYIIKRGKNLIYRRRIPSELKPYIQMTEFKKALVPDMKSARIMASHYDNIFSKMITNAMLGFTDISKLLLQLGINGTITKRDSLYDAFMKSKKNISSTSYNEYKQQLQLFKVLLPEEIDKLSYRHIDKVISVISTLPKRNIQKYRELSLRELIKVDTKESDRISVKSQNEYLKTLRALLKFAEQRGYIDKYLEVTLFKNKTSARNQRQVLTNSEINMLFNHADIRLRALSKILYYSGMRLSEVYKCKLSEINGVQCFDLRDNNLKLKTESSYRVIPIHKDILPNIELLLDSAISIKANTATRIASKALNTKSKTLYSLRHSFATALASKSVDTNLVSELLGHSHKSITMNRYVKGFSVVLLSDTINKL